MCICFPILKGIYLSITCYLVISKFIFLLATCKCLALNGALLRSFLVLVLHLLILPALSNVRNDPVTNCVANFWALSLFVCC